MSKFFKALETAEREQAAQERESPAAAPEPTIATALASTPAAAEQPPATPSPPRPAVAAPPAPPTPAALASPSLYGSPLARETGSTPFDRMVGAPAAPVVEPGELDDHLVSLLAPTSIAAEQYRTIRLHIENQRRERGVRVVAVTSPVRGDGKTVTAINVAGALAQAPDARVALVELDVRHPGVARCLGLSNARGLSTYLLDHQMSVDTVLERPAGVGFAVIVAGPRSSMPYELLKSPRLTALFATLRERFDYVVVDTPPVLPFPDVGILRDFVDGVLLVVRANRTPREMLRESAAAIGSDRALGVIFNDDERTAAAAERIMDGAGWRGVLGRPLGGSRAA